MAKPRPREFLEPCREFRSRKHHWRFWPRAGVVRRFHLKNDADGCGLLVGALDFEIDLAALASERPDIYGTLKIMMDGIGR